MKLIHKVCGNSVNIDVGELIKVLGNVSCDTVSLKINSVQLLPVSGRIVDTKFFCPDCGNVELESLIGICTHGCNRTVNVNKLYLASESGGTYCENCIKRFEKSEKLIPIVEMVSTVRYK